MPRWLPAPHRAFATNATLRRKRLGAAWRLVRAEGPVALGRLALNRLALPALGRLARPLLAPRLRRVLGEAAPGRVPVVVVSTVDYAFPYRQRPQHLALALARIGHPVFYVSPRSGHDGFLGCGFPAPGLCVTDAEDALPALLPARPILLLLSTDNRVDPDFVAGAKGWGARLVYDYIDHIDPAISLMPIPPAHLAAHHALLRDPEVLVVASARVLAEEVAALRGAGLLLAPNAVDGRHFAVARDPAALVPEMAAAVARGRPVLGYFGALAAWFDYALVEQAARALPEVTLVLVGPDYDGTAAAWRARAGRLPENLILVPGLPYARLPAQAAWFDAAMVPFLVNDITRATSPLKLYEYFALGLPVVSTPLPECARHAPPVLLAEGVPAFAAAARAALAVRADPAHRALLAEEAAAHDWTARAAAIVAARLALDAAPGVARNSYPPPAA